MGPRSLESRCVNADLEGLLRDPAFQLHTSVELDSIINDYSGKIINNDRVSNCNESVYTGGPGVAFMLAHK